MNIKKGNLYIVVLGLALLLMFSSPSVSAQGLVDDAHTTYYKMNDKHAVKVFYADHTEDGRVLLGISEYEENPDHHFYNSWDVGKYLIGDTIIYPLEQPSYIQNGYIWNEEVIYEISSSEIVQRKAYTNDYEQQEGTHKLRAMFPSQITVEVGENREIVGMSPVLAPSIQDNSAEFNKKKKELDLNKVQAALFNADYIEGPQEKFEELSINTMPGFGTFMLLWIGIPVCVAVTIVIGGTVLLIKLFRRKRGFNEQQSS